MSGAGAHVRATPMESGKWDGFLAQFSFVLASGTKRVCPLFLETSHRGISTDMQQLLTLE
jgi:hypothetical protein